MTPEYLPTTPEGRLARVVEELGEVVQAIGKAQRFGMSERWPAGGDTNAHRLLGEMNDLRHALDQFEPDVIAAIEAAT